MAVTPITSLVTKIVAKTTGPINTADLETSISVVATVFNISESDMKKDFIEEDLIQTLQKLSHNLKQQPKV